MKEKVVDIASRYLILNLAFLPVIVGLRIAEYLYLSHAPFLQEHPCLIESVGLLYDVRAFLVLTLLVFVPYLLISLLNRRAGNLIYMLFLGLLTILQFALIRYFSVNLVPLDDVLFRYSFSEIRMIITNSDGLDFISFLPLILILILFGVVRFFISRVSIKPGIMSLLTFCYLSSLFLSLLHFPQKESFVSDAEYHFTVNKSDYFIRKGLVSLFYNNRAVEDAEIRADIDRYQNMHREFDFTSKKYPLVHKATTRDVLGPFFNLGEKPPNLVFIIVESLSSACIGDQSWYGNFTPFLDSLKNKSLYWDNFLSSSERTFHVFASIFGSLPFGNGEFQNDESQIPFHYSFIRYLNENGYFTGVYYGGDLSFTHYKDFFRKQGIDYMLEYFGPEYEAKQKQYPDFLWGYHDEFTFARSLEVLDSLNPEPHLDIYLTLSTHNPFQPPNASYYLERYKEITNQPGYPKVKKERTDRNPEIFSSILYTDEALRNFFKDYSKREDYNNTIFLITGDHFFMELGYTSVSAIERYHVPLIIFSPMLKHPAQISSVSSHQDITPSLIALLNKKYDFNGPSFVHWLGQGIDTTASFRNIHTMQFVTSDWHLVDFLQDEFFLSMNRLYKIKPGLQTELVADETKLTEMKEDLRVTSAVSRYANKNDRLILQELFRHIKFDTIHIHSFDTSGIRSEEKPPMFINLVPPFRFDTSLWEIRYDMEFLYRIGGFSDTARLPRLILTIEDSSFNIELYHQLRFPARVASDVKPGNWNRFRVSESLNLHSIDSLKGKWMKIYFFNNRECNIGYDTLKINILGIN